jgi:ribonuclease BN (tRNA processing enzyme)
MRHSSHTVGYRVRVAGRTICYLPDNELEKGDFAVGGAEWRAELRAFLDGVDLMIHDATYTEEEYPTRHGWGHSTFEQAFTLARECGVRRLLFFHHAPERTDDQLATIVETYGERSDRFGGPHVEAAREGVSLPIDGR